MGDKEDSVKQQEYNQSKNTSITTKLLLPLIGSDPRIQKKILEDPEHSFKIKLRKVKRFKNKSQNYYHYQNFDECKNQ